MLSGNLQRADTAARIAQVASQRVWRIYGGDALLVAGIATFVEARISNAHV